MRNRDDSEQKRRRDFENDVWYEAWRSGLNPDRATDCAMDCYWDGKTPEQCVGDLARQQRDERERARIAYEHQQEGGDDGHR